MITRDVLGRAHGALAVSGGNGPCTGVLREILAAIEGHVPDTSSAAVTMVSNLGDPTLMYVSATASTNLGMVTVEQLRELPAVQLRFIAALLEHATVLVDEVLHEED